LVCLRHETPTGAAPQPQPIKAWPLIMRKVRVAIHKSRAALRLFSWINVRKGIHCFLRGDFSLIAASLRNLMAQSSALAQSPLPRVMGSFEPRPDIPGRPLVTIVIPCFNDGGYVAEAVSSALAQTFTDLEVLVVDGGSTDGTTPAIVAGLEGPRVRALLRTDGRHLPGDNRNFGIEAARSPYICCLDADDRLDPTYIEKALFLLEWRGFDVVGTSLRKFGAANGGWQVPAQPVFDDVLVGNITVVCALFRRCLWSSVGGFRDFGLAHDHVPEDWDFWFRCAAIGARFRNLSTEALLNYRVRPQGGSVSSQAGTPAMALQRQMIARHNAALVTPAARKMSRTNAALVLRPTNDGVAMRFAMERAATVDQRPTLLLAIPFFVVGGAERLLSTVIGGLAAAGWRVIVVSTEFEPPQAGDALPWFTAHTSECYALPRFLSPEDWQGFVNYVLSSRNPAALLIAGSRFFYDLLPRLALEYPAMARLDLLFNTEGHVAKHCEHRAYLTGALCESQPVLEWLRTEAAWPRASVRCIPSGIDTAEYSPGPRPAALSAELGIGPDDIVVGWSGRLSGEKAPEVFLELAARCADLGGLHFVMTGGGPLAERIGAQAANMPSGMRVHIRGLVDDIRDYYRLYDIYTLTSRLDGRPLAVMEAQASGCAVLASRIGGVPDIIREGVTGQLANPADAADFERVLRHMVADRAALASMRRNALALAEAEFSVSAMTDAYCEALEAAAADQRARRSLL
jgi:glycosyltransferase involved in cell wall biosynthesis